MRYETQTTARKAAREYPDATVEIIGAWVWLTFGEKPSSETRASLKASGFRWSSRRGQWANSCGVAKKARMKNGHPRDVYGSVAVYAEEESA